MLHCLHLEFVVCARYYSHVLLIKILMQHVLFPSYDRR